MAVGDTVPLKFSWSPSSNFNGYLVSRTYVNGVVINSTLLPISAPVIEKLNVELGDDEWTVTFITHTEVPSMCYNLVLPVQLVTQNMDTQTWDSIPLANPYITVFCSTVKLYKATIPTSLIKGNLQFTVGTPTPYQWPFRTSASAVFKVDHRINLAVVADSAHLDGIVASNAFLGVNITSRGMFAARNVTVAAYFLSGYNNTTGMPILGRLVHSTVLPEISANGSAIAIVPLTFLASGNSSLVLVVDPDLTVPGDRFADNFVALNVTLAPDVILNVSLAFDNKTNTVVVGVQNIGTEVDVGGTLNITDDHGTVLGQINYTNLAPKKCIAFTVALPAGFNATNTTAFEIVVPSPKSGLAVDKTNTFPLALAAQTEFVCGNVPTPSECTGSIQITQTFDVAWVDGGKNYSEWDVAVRVTTLPLYALTLNMTHSDGDIQIWGAFLVPGSTSIYTLDDYNLQQGVQVSPGTSLNLGYITTSLNPANFSVASASCVPVPRNCSISFTQQLQTSYEDDTGYNQQYALSFTNYGTVIAESVDIKITLPTDASVIPMLYNFNPQGPVLNRVFLANIPFESLPPRQSTDNYAGYLVTNPVPPAGTTILPPVVEILSSNCLSG